MTCQYNCKTCLCQPDQTALVISLAREIPHGMKLLQVMRKQDLTNAQILAIMNVVVNDVMPVCLEVNYAYDKSGTRVHIINL